MILYHNAKFYTMDKEGDFVRSVLVENGKILDTFRDIPHIPNAKMVDLHHNFVFPGFIDTHTHSFEGGLSSLAVNLENVTSLTQVFESLSQSQPISGMHFSFHFDETLLDEKRFPSLEEFDKIFPDKAAILRRVDGHSCLINSVAARKIFKHNELPINFNGYLDKRYNDIAANWFHSHIDNDWIKKAYYKASDVAIKHGCTTVHTMIGDGYSDPEHYELIRDSLSDFDVDFILYPQITDVEKALNLGAKRIGGCILADGSFGSHTAALLQPYSDNVDTKGSLYHSDEFWRSVITKAHQNDLQFAVHAIGDAAISQIIKIYDQVQLHSPKELRHEVIHNELTDDKMIDIIARSGSSAVMQPMFDRLWAGENGLYHKRLGMERCIRTNRFRSIWDRDILLTGGSDWYVTDLDPLKGISAAINMHYKPESLSIFEAVSIFTKNAARLSFDEDNFGMIKKNFNADFTILAQDIFSSSNIAEIPIIGVVKEGSLINFSN